MTKTALRHLALTSPHMKGPDVERLQRKLHVPDDGEYGPVTAAAVHRSKSLLGFPAKALDSGASTFYLEILYGERNAPASYAKTALKRADQRKALEAAKPAASKARAAAVKWALSHEGYSERASLNRGDLLDNWQIANGHGKFSGPSEKGWPWCGVYTWASYHFGADIDLDGRLRDCGWTYYAARSGQAGLHLVPFAQAIPGDIALLFGIGTHQGLVRAKYSGSGPLLTIEGNTGGSRPADGGMVAKGSRAPRDVTAVVRVELPR